MTQYCKHRTDSKSCIYCRISKLEKDNINLTRILSLLIKDQLIQEHGLSDYLKNKIKDELKNDN